MAVNADLVRDWLVWLEAKRSRELLVGQEGFMIELCLDWLAKHEWQPIETAPKDGTHILAEFPDEGISECWWFVGKRVDGSEYGHEWCAITLPQHGCGCCSDENVPPSRWMPLPGTTIPN